MIKSDFLHMGITVKNPERFVRFYAKHFGFKKVREVSLGDSSIIFIRSGRMAFEIFQSDTPRPQPAPEETGYDFPGWRHIAFNVENVDKKLAEMGDDAQITLGPIDFNEFIPNWRSVWIRDPEGNIIEISQGYKDDTIHM